MTDDGAFRVMTARTSDAARVAIERQGAEGSNATLFAELLTGALLYRETMAPTLRVQCILQGSGESGHIVADSHPDGTLRGLVQCRAGHDAITLGPGAILKMMRTLPNGDLHQGAVRLDSEEGISGALMLTMQRSEQIASVVSVGARLRGGALYEAAGYLVQLLPEAPEAEEALRMMTDRLERMPSVSQMLEAAPCSADALMDRLLEGMPHTLLGESAPRFGCSCDRVRILTGLSTLGRGEILEMVELGEPLEIRCDYCGEAFVVRVEELRGLLRPS